MTRRLPLTLPIVLASALSFPVLITLAQPAMAQVQQQPISIQVAAGSLEQALNGFGRQAGIVLVFPTELTKGLHSEGLQGSYTVREGLTRLLAGSNIRFHLDGNTATLEKGSTGNAMLLNPLRVSSSGLTDDLKAAGAIGIAFDELTRTQPSDLKDVFAGESSVSVGGSMPVNQKLYLRGVEETALSVTIDGARQNNKVFHHSATTLIDPSLLKSVRASAGISPADDGPGAIGGSIVFETVDVADVLASDDPFGGFVNLRYDSNSQGFTTGASVYGQQQGFEALVFVNRASGDDYEDGKGDTVNYTEADLLSRLAKVAYQAESGDRFELSYESVNDAAVRPYRANFGGLTAGRPTPESREYDLARTNIVFNYSNQAGSDLWNPNVVVADSETELATTEVPLADATAKITYTGVTESQSVVVENLFVTEFSEITAGMDYYDDSTVFRFEGDPDIVEKVENIGVFTQFRQTFEPLKLSYGLRYDQQDFTGTDNSDQDDNGISANIFAEYAASQYLTVKAGYASVWGGVALAETFILNSAWDYSGGIKSVQSDNIVVGFESIVDHFRFGANIYETDIVDGRTPSWRGGPGLTADFEITGYDIFVSYEQSRNTLSLKYSNITADKDGEEANSFDGNYFTAPLGKLITVSGSTTFESLPLTLGMNAEISLNNEFVAYGVKGKQESYTVVNVFADYPVLKSFSLRLAINNLTDEEYTDRASYGQEFASVKTLLEPGRTALVSARYDF